jgi:hypothetical protein
VRASICRRPRKGSTATRCARKRSATLRKVARILTPSRPRTRSSFAFAGRPARTRRPTTAEIGNLQSKSPLNSVSCRRSCITKHAGCHGYRGSYLDSRRPTSSPSSEFNAVQLRHRRRIRPWDATREPDPHQRYSSNPGIGSSKPLPILISPFKRPNSERFLALLPEATT